MATDLFVAGVVEFTLPRLLSASLGSGQALSLTTSGFLGAFVDELWCP